MSHLAGLKGPLPMHLSALSACTTGTASLHGFCYCAQCALVPLRQLCERYARQLTEHTTAEARQLFPLESPGSKMVLSCMDDMAAFVDKAARQTQVV